MSGYGAEHERVRQAVNDTFAKIRADFAARPEGQITVTTSLDPKVIAMAASMRQAAYAKHYRRLRIGRLTFQWKRR